MLARQSTTVPNTSKNKACTSGIGSLLGIEAAEFTLQRGKTARNREGTKRAPASHLFQARSGRGS
jgi:hypothetical protein